MSSPNPQPAVDKSGGFQHESSTFTSIGDLFRFFQPKKLKVSKNSPPNVTDVEEMELVYDKVTNKLWIKSNGALKSAQFV